MIAYKIFTKQDYGKLGPWLCIFRLEYDPKYIMQRPDNWGPFACFDSMKSLKRFNSAWDASNNVTYKVKIKKSIDTHLWADGDNLYDLPPGTILADEFEILERVK